MNNEARFVLLGPNSNNFVAAVSAVVVTFAVLSSPTPNAVVRKEGRNSVQLVAFSSGSGVVAIAMGARSGEIKTNLFGKDAYKEITPLKMDAFVGAGKDSSINPHQIDKTGAAGKTSEDKVMLAVQTVGFLTFLLMGLLALNYRPKLVLPFLIGAMGMEAGVFRYIFKSKGNPH